jgi:hypothetical protein
VRITNKEKRCNNLNAIHLHPNTKYSGWRIPLTLRKGLNALKIPYYFVDFLLVSLGQDGCQVAVFNSFENQKK